MLMGGSINGIGRQTKFHSLIASKNLTRSISGSRPFTITGKRVEAHRIKSLKLIFLAPTQSVINRNRILNVYVRNAFAYTFNLTSNASFALSSHMKRIIRAIHSNQYYITNPISKSSLLKMGFSSIELKSMDQKFASPIQSAWPMRIYRTLSTILSKSAERFDVEGPMYPKRHNALAFNIVSEDKPTIHAARAASWDLKNCLVSSAEPQYGGQQGRFSALIASAPFRMRRQEGIRDQSNLISYVTKSDSELGFGRIISYLSGSLSGSELFNLKPSILPSRFKLVLQFLKKHGIAVLDRWNLASSNRIISIDHATLINSKTSRINMASINNTTSMIVKPYARTKLEPQSTDTGILAPDYHAFKKSLGSKIRSKESELNLLYYSPRPEHEMRADAHVSEVEFGRESILRKDTTQIAALDLDQFSDQICSIIEKRLKVERERRGLYG